MAVTDKINTTPTAYTSIIAPSIYNSESQLLAFVQTSDVNRKSEILQNINRELSRQEGPPGFAGNQMQYLQTLLRQKLSKAKTPIAANMIGIEDSAALEKVINAAYASNMDPFTWLETYNLSLSGGKEIKQPDTTTRFTKQIQTALNYKDLGDARQAYSNAYFTAYGQYPAADLDKKFQDSFNSQVKKQNQPTTTAGKTEYAPIYDTKSKPVIDPKTKKQVIDKFGNKKFSSIKTVDGVKQYTPTTTGISTSQGDGFTAEEQKQQLADFLVANFPEESFDPANLGGLAKSAYDSLRATNTNNYDEAPDLAKLSPVIKSLIQSTDTNVSNEIMKKYQSDVRSRTASRFMGIADSLNAGNDANEVIDPLMRTLSTSLETDINIKDPLLIKLLNFQGSDGKYRLPNEYEVGQAIISDSRYGKTSTAKNEAVNLFQSFKNAIIQ